MPVSDFAARSAARKTTRWKLSALGASILLTAIFTALAAASDSGKAMDRYVVVLKDSVDHPGAVARNQVEERGGKVGFVYRHALKGYSAELPESAVAALKRNPNVTLVAPDNKAEMFSQAIPSGIDRIFATENSSLSIDEEDHEESRIDVDVAILDTGIDHEHPDLDVVARTYCDWWGFSAKCTDNTGADSIGHGTHVAGTVGAIDNEEGVAGVAPGARLWSVKVLDPWGSDSEIAAGIDWVTAHASEIEVANMSLGCGCWMPATEAAIEGSVEEGVVYVVAAGNSAMDAEEFSPARNEDAITVSALADFDGQPGGKAGSTPCRTEFESTWGAQGDDDLAKFSNWGAWSVDVAAPGVCINSAVPGGEYESYSGTSMAAPHVAGAAAILASNSNPSSESDVETIRQTIVEAGNQNWEDTSEDGVQEPLLDVGNEEIFTGVEVEPPSATTGGTSSVSISSATMHGTVNPNGFNTTYKFEYGPTTSYGSEVPVPEGEAGSESSGVEVEEPAGGLEAATTYHYRLAATNAGGTVYGEDKTFVTKEAKAPSATTEAATGVGVTGAKLNGTVNPNSSKTTYQFEYGTTTSYGSKMPASPKEIGSGGSGVEVGETIGGLEPATTYHFRVAATNSAGTTYGEDKTFKTQEAKAPSATTEAATKVTASGAELHGTVNPNNVETTYQFEYGLTTSYGSKEPASPAGIGSGGSGVEVGDMIGGLEPATTYHFRVAATSSAGTTYGEDETFVTQEEESSEWEITLPVPSEEEEEEKEEEQSLFAVDCYSSSNCLALGDYSEPEKSGFLAESWNGEEWGLVPSSGGYELNDVSCPYASSCVAVGSFEGVASVRLLSKPSSWSSMYLQLPSLGSTSELVAADCVTAPSLECWAVGSYTEFGEEKPLAVRVVGSLIFWTLYSTPDEGDDSRLTGVSCNEVSSCFAVGSYTESGEAYPLFMGWYGSEWGREWAFYPEGEGEGDTYLNDISCTEETSSCMVVGTDETDSPSVPFAISWWPNVGGYSTAMPLEPGDAEGDIELHRVSCQSESECYAAGEYVYGAEGETKSLIQAWDGSDWAISPTTSPEGHAWSGLKDVSCSSSSDCIAVGSSSENGAEFGALAMQRE